MAHVWPVPAATWVMWMERIVARPTAVLPSSVIRAVMSAVPVSVAVTAPEDETCATRVLALDQVAERPEITAPVLSRAIAVKVRAPGATMATVGGETTTDEIGRASCRERGE